MKITEEKLEEEMPESIRGAIEKRMEGKSREEIAEVNIEEMLRDIIENQIDLFNKFKTNERFNKEFTDAMFKLFQSVKI